MYYYLKEDDLIQEGDEYLCLCEHCRELGRELWLICGAYLWGGQVRQVCRKIRRKVKCTPKGNIL